MDPGPLRRLPLFSGLSGARLAALAQPAEVQAFGVGPLQSAPPSTIRVLISGAVQFAVMPHPQGVVPAPVPEAVDVALDQSPPLRPGDIVPSAHYVDRPPHLVQHVSSAATLAVFKPAALDAIGQSAAWRFGRLAWRRFRERLQIAAALQCGAPFRNLSQHDRALLIKAMRWQSVAPGEQLTRAGTHAEALYVPGADTVCEAVLEDPDTGPMTLLDQGVGGLIGIAAIDVERPVWSRRHRVTSSVLTGTRVARLDALSFGRLVCQSESLRRFAIERNALEGNLAALVTAAAKSPLLEAP